MKAIPDESKLIAAVSKHFEFIDLFLNQSDGCWFLGTVTLAWMVLYLYIFASFDLFLIYLSFINLTLMSVGQEIFTVTNTWSTLCIYVVWNLEVSKHWLKLDRLDQMSRLMTKLTKWFVCPAKTQISLSIPPPVWSKFLLCTQWIAKNPSFLHVDSEDWSDWADAQAEDSDQIGRMPRLIWVFAGPTSVCWFCHVVAQIILFSDSFTVVLPTVPK